VTSFQRLLCDVLGSSSASPQTTQHESKGVLTDLAHFLDTQHQSSPSAATSGSNNKNQIGLSNSGGNSAATNNILCTPMRVRLSAIIGCEAAEEEEWLMPLDVAIEWAAAAANAAAASDEGESAPHLVVVRERLAVCQLLVDRGAPLTYNGATVPTMKKATSSPPSSRSTSPATTTAAASQPPITSIPLSPLHRAVLSGSLAVVEWVLQQKRRHDKAEGKLVKNSSSGGQRTENSSKIGGESFLTANKNRLAKGLGKLSQSITTAATSLALPPSSPHLSASSSSESRQHTASSNGLAHSSSSPSTSLSFVVDINHPTRFDGEELTALHLAVQLVGSDLEAHTTRQRCEPLLLDGRDERQQTMRSAMLNNRLAIVKALLATGADTNAVDVEGRTPLFIAARWGDVEAVELLLVGERRKEKDSHNDDDDTVVGNENSITNRKHSLPLAIGKRRLHVASKAVEEVGGDDDDDEVDSESEDTSSTNSPSPTYFELIAKNSFPFTATPSPFFSAQAMNNNAVPPQAVLGGDIGNISWSADNDGAASHLEFYLNRFVSEHKYATAAAEDDVVVRTNGGDSSADSRHHSYHSSNSLYYEHLLLPIARRRHQRTIYCPSDDGGETPLHVAAAHDHVHVMKKILTKIATIGSAAVETPTHTLGVGMEGLKHSLLFAADGSPLYGGGIVGGSSAAHGGMGGGGGITSCLRPAAYNNSAAAGGGGGDDDYYNVFWDKCGDVPTAAKDLWRYACELEAIGGGGGGGMMGTSDEKGTTAHILTTRRRDDYNGGGLRPIHVAAKHGSLAALRFLVLECCVDTNARTRCDGWTALHYAVSEGHADCAVFLLEHSRYHGDADADALLFAASRRHDDDDDDDGIKYYDDDVPIHTASALRHQHRPHSRNASSNVDGGHATPATTTQHNSAGCAHPSSSPLSRQCHTNITLRTHNRCTAIHFCALRNRVDLVDAIVKAMVRNVCVRGMALVREEEEDDRRKKEAEKESKKKASSGDEDTKINENDEADDRSESTGIVPTLSLTQFTRIAEACIKAVQQHLLAARDVVGYTILHLSCIQADIEALSYLCDLTPATTTEMARLVLAALLRREREQRQSPVAELSMRGRGEEYNSPPAPDDETPSPLSDPLRHIPPRAELPQALRCTVPLVDFGIVDARDRTALAIVKDLLDADYGYGGGGGGGGGPSAAMGGGGGDPKTVIVASSGSHAAGNNIDAVTSADMAADHTETSHHPTGNDDTEPLRSSTPTPPPPAPAPLPHEAHDDGEANAPSMLIVAGPVSDSLSGTIRIDGLSALRAADDGDHQNEDTANNTSFDNDTTATIHVPTMITMVPPASATDSAVSPTPSTVPLNKNSGATEEGAATNENKTLRQSPPPASALSYTSPIPSPDHHHHNKKQQHTCEVSMLRFGKLKTALSMLEAFGQQQVMEMVH